MSKNSKKYHKPACSGAQSILNEIGDLLSGKKKAVSSNATTTANSGSLGVISLDFSTDMGDIWGGNGNFGDGGESLFDNSKAVDMTDLEGIALYNASNKQCLQVMKDSCENSAILNMATSAYNIMITQDCNMYEKSLNKKREQVLTTVRQAEKILREARLEEYRAHNSRDVNECISKVQTAMFAETACGANYKRCLDYSGAYINPSTGGAVYSPRLFELTNIITLEGATGNTDLLGQNPAFDKFLETKKMYAESALDSCRTIADNVWTEFKRMALIEIAQAQDEKIQQVKDSCVSTMAECYDNQSGQLKDMDTTTAQASGAISASAARAMCKEKVDACSNLYDGGLDELKDFVNTVDSIKITEGCTDALTKYVQDELCAPAANETDRKYPWGCRDKKRTDIEKAIGLRKDVYCAVQQDDTLNIDIDKTVTSLVDSVIAELDVMYDTECDAVGGIWVESGDTGDSTYVKNTNFEQKFYSAVIGGTKKTGDDGVNTFGVCYANSLKIQCEMQSTATNGLAKYDEVAGKCVFEPDWYKNRCEFIGGYYENDTCYIEKDRTSTSNQ